MLDLDQPWIRFTFKFDGYKEFVLSQDMVHIELFLRQHKLLDTNQSTDELIRMNYIEIQSMEYFMSTNNELNMLLDGDRETKGRLPDSILGRILKPIQFRSNLTNDTFSIYTNDYLLIKSFYSCCRNLYKGLTMYPFINKHSSIGFLHHLSILIESLPKATLLSNQQNAYNDDNDDEVYDYESIYYANTISKYPYKKYPNTQGLIPNTFAKDYETHDFQCEYQHIEQDTEENYVLYETLVNAFRLDSYVNAIQPITIEGYIKAFTKGITNPLTDPY
jgi:hypothetical protein